MRLESGWKESLKSVLSIYAELLWETFFRAKKSELFVIDNDSVEVRFPDRLKFSNCAPGFVATIHVWGLDLPEKEKMKHLRYDAGFEIWASCQEKVYFRRLFALLA